MTDLNLSVRWLDSPSDLELKRLQTVFEAAFDADVDFQKHLFGGDKSLMSLKFYSNILSAKIGGRIQVASVGPNAEDIVGAAIWFGPGQELNGTEEQRRGGGSLFLDTAPPHIRNWWFETLIPKLDTLASTSLGSGFKQDQWSLLLFGVVPEYHRRGVGKAMIKFVEQIAQEDKVSLVLETHSSHDVMIYERIGYQVKGQVTMNSSHSGEVTMYQLQKSPQ